MTMGQSVNIKIKDKNKETYANDMDEENTIISRVKSLQARIKHLEKQLDVRQTY